MFLAGVLAYLYFFSSVGPHLLLAGPQNFLLQSGKDPRCSQKVVFEGSCFMNLSDIQYDPMSNSCISVRGGGCSSSRIFASQLECENTCVTGWAPLSAKDTLLLNNTFISELTNQPTSFDAAGKAILEETELSLHDFDLIAAHFVDKNTILALVEEGITTEITRATSKGVSFDRLGVYALLFTKNSKGVYELRESTLVDQESIDSATFSNKGTIVTITYEYSNCGGSLPQCGTKFSKKIDLLNGIKVIE
jgi:hypothetical protein